MAPNKYALTLNGGLLATKDHWILYARNSMIVLIAHHFCRADTRMLKLTQLLWITRHKFNLKMNLNSISDLKNTSVANIWANWFV